MSMSIANKHVAILAEDNYQELELHYPHLRLIEAGARVSVLGAGEKTYHSSRGYPVTVDADAVELSAEHVAGGRVPGGMAADRMRQHESVVGLVRDAAAAGNPGAWLCHGGWVEVSGDIRRGKRATPLRSI